MNVVVCSAKHAPGATTLALALTAAVSRGSASSEALYVEADPAGGDLAGDLGLAPEPGLVSLAASARHASRSVDPWPHTQPLPAGGRAVIAATDPTEAANAIAVLAPRLGAVFGGTATSSIVDAGRWVPGSISTPLLEQAHAVLIAARPDLSGIEHARSACASLRSLVRGLVGVVLVGERPYRAEEVAQAVNADVVTAVPWDRRGAAGLRTGPSAAAARTPLVRAARTISDTLERSGQAA